MTGFYLIRRGDSGIGFVSASCGRIRLFVVARRGHVAQLIHESDVITVPVSKVTCVAQLKHGLIFSYE